MKTRKTYHHWTSLYTLCTAVASWLSSCCSYPERSPILFANLALFSTLSPNHYQKHWKKANWKISLHGKKMKKILTTNRTLLSLLNAQIAFYNTKTPAIFEYSLNCSPIGWYKYTQTWELRTSSILDSRTPGTFIFQREPWSLTRWSYKLPQY